MLDRPPKDAEMPRPGAHPAVWIWGLICAVIFLGVLALLVWV